MIAVPTYVKLLELKGIQWETEHETKQKQGKEEWIRNDVCTELHELINFCMALPKCFPTNLHLNGNHFVEKDSFVKIDN